MIKRFNITILAFLVLLSYFFCFIPVCGYAEKEQESINSNFMTTSQVIVLGAIEGVTEYLPISSTGHLLLAEQLMGIGEDSYQSTIQREHIKLVVEAYIICIQVGAILAVLLLYRRRIQQIMRGVMSRDATGRRLLFNILVGFFPATVLTSQFHTAINSYFLGPWSVIIAWAIGGLAILVVCWSTQPRVRSTQSSNLLDNMAWQRALIIGFAQCIALWPGISCSLITVVSGLLLGLTLEASVEYSFLLGAMMLGAATAQGIFNHSQFIIQNIDKSSLIIGIIITFISTIISIKWMIYYTVKHGLEFFGYYRMITALIATVFLIVNRIIWI